MAKNVKVKTVGSLSNNAFLGLIFIVLGIFFIMNQDMLETLFTILGAILIVLGAVELFDMNWIVGAIELALGVIIIVCGNTLSGVMILILGIAVLVYALFLLVTLIIKFSKKGAKPHASTIIFSLIAPLLLLVLGILLILQFAGVANVFVVIGIIALVVGSFLVFYELVKKLIKNAKKNS